MSEPADIGIITAGRGIRSAQLKVVVETASKIVDLLERLDDGGGIALAVIYVPDPAVAMG